MEQLRTWMDANKVSHAALALRVGVSRVQINRIAVGTSRPSFELATKLEGVTGIALADFMQFERKRPASRKREQVAA